MFPFLLNYCKCSSTQLLSQENFIRDELKSKVFEIKNKKIN